MLKNLEKKVITLIKFEKKNLIMKIILKQLKKM